jgi:ABC-2 type transport system ATP-binding protein
VARSSELVAAAGALSAHVSGEPSLDDVRLRVSAPIPPDSRLIDLVRALDEAGVDAVDVERRPSTLDDVFLTLTASRSPA